MGKVTFTDISLKEYTLENIPRLKRLRQQLFDRKSEICIERAKYLTEYLTDKKHQAEPYVLRRTNGLRHFMANKAAVFPDDNLIAGSTTSKPVGAPLYPEFFALSIWPELETISTRAKNPQILSAEDAEYLNFHVYPYWLDNSVLELSRAKEPASVELFEQFIYFIASKAGCISHTIPHYQIVITQGLTHLMEVAAAKEKELAAKPQRNATEERSLIFFKSVQIALDGVLQYAQNLSKRAAELAKKATSQEQRKYFEEIAQICANVPAKPATTFREALNAIWIVRVGLMAENSNMAMSPGRLDQILYPYYAKDIAEGRLTVSEALELVGCFWLKLSDNIIMVPEVSEELFGGAGNVPAVTLGGIDASGEDAVNDLTYIMLRVTELLQTRDPNLCARYHYVKNTVQYRNRVAEVIANTHAVPALYNDIEAIQTLVNQGVSPEHASDYGVIGCVELGSAGRSFTASSSIILNLVTPLELTLHNGTRPFTGDKVVGPQLGDPNTFKDFNQFWQVYVQQLTRVIKNAIHLNNLMGTIHQEYLPTPLLSAVFTGPFDKGQDVTWGGALYNSSGATNVGFADVVDSLNAIEKVIYEDGQMTFTELTTALKADFVGYERLQQYLVNRTPKYGTDDKIAKKNARLLIDLIYDTYNNAQNYRGGNYNPAFWTMTNHAGLGKLTSALPNGRKAMQAFASGITPVSGAASQLTACLQAIGDLNPMHIPGGYALNLKFSNIENEQDIETFGAYIDTYFRNHGLQVQFNIMTYKTLLEAKKDPTKYPHLMVRVSGYSAYFNDLNDIMKDELITRTQYNLRTGQAVPFIVGLPASK